jgi:dTDP-3-amino-3,4,6-trideoxy-alpha-D-glucose transaminase
VHPNLRRSTRHTHRKEIEMKIPYIDLARANKPLREKIRSTIDNCLEKSVFLRGLETEAFEHEWADYCGQKYAVACNSGTDALTIAALAGELTKVIIPANTLPLTGIGLSRAGTKVEIGDVDSNGWLSSESKMQVPVLLYGRVPESLPTGTRLVDAAHGHGWKPPEGILAAWSFYPTKSLGALGDAGAVTTNDANVAARMRDICGRDDVMRDSRQITSRIDEIQAAVLRVKLQFLDEWLGQRQEIAKAYDKRLEPYGITLSGHSFNHIYAISITNRDALKSYLEGQEIETKVHWKSSLDQVHGPWISKSDAPNSRKWCSNTLSLPMFPGLNKDEISRVCDGIEKWIESTALENR